MRKLTVIVLGLLSLVFAGAIVLPWVQAYRSDQGCHYCYGRINGHELECVAVDGTHFDRYFCLVFDSSAGERVSYNHGRISLDGQQVQFPSGKNAGFLRPDGLIQFATLTERDIIPFSPGKGEIYYIFGRVPKFKHFAFGVPSVEFAGQLFQSVK